ncbi:IclR family transcriptional regulator [Natronorubrum sp. FCH18a]|uniref:IclR family transcriptional regulator n=1 Tax=Natronorubrum sp. FCH18a TaxID=3447018 RepID=UPI003F51A9D9
MVPPNTDGRKVKTSEKVFDILETIKELDGVTATKLSKQFDMAISTAYEHLNTMEEAGYIIKDENNNYRIALKFLEFGMYARKESKLMEASDTHLEFLADETKEAALLVTEEHGECVYLDLKSGQRGVTTARHGWIGKRIPIHCSAAGKSILAHLDEDKMKSIIENNELEQFTDTTITNKTDMLNELGNIEEEGIAINDEEAVEGIRAVGTAILQEGEVLGAISVSGPAHRITDDRIYSELKETILSTANEIELDLAHSQIETKK